MVTNIQAIATAKPDQVSVKTGSNVISYAPTTIFFCFTFSAHTTKNNSLHLNTPDFSTVLQIFWA